MGVYTSLESGSVDGSSSTLSPVRDDGTFFVPQDEVPYHFTDLTRNRSGVVPFLSVERFYSTFFRALVSSVEGFSPDESPEGSTSRVVTTTLKTFVETMCFRRNTRLEEGERGPCRPVTLETSHGGWVTSGSRNRGTGRRRGDET